MYLGNWIAWGFSFSDPLRICEHYPNLDNAINSIYNIKQVCFYPLYGLFIHTGA